MKLWCLVWLIAMYEHWNVLAFVGLKELKYITDEVIPIDEPTLELPEINQDDICASSELPTVMLIVSNVDGSTAQRVEWRSTSTYPEKCDVQYNLMYRKRYKPTEIIRRTFNSGGEFQTGNLLEDTDYSYELKLSKPGVANSITPSVLRTLRTHKMDRRITIRPIESGGNYVNVKWTKVQPGNTVRVTVLGVIPAFIQSVGTSIRVGGLDACTNYKVLVELLNGNEIIERKQPIEVTTSYPALNAPEHFDIKLLSSVFGHKLTWAPLTIKYPSTCRLSYRVERETRKGNEVEKHNFALNETKLEIVGLTHGVEYSYKVQAVLNSVHGGKFSDPLKITEIPKPSEPMKPVVTWTGVKLKVDWTGKLNLLEQIQQVHLLYSEDGMPKKRIAQQADGHLLVDVPTGQLDCNMFFAVENHAGISPFTTVPVPAQNPLSVPQNLQIKYFKNTLVHSVGWSPVSPDCDITYVLQTEVMNGGGKITQFNTKTKETELTFKDVNPSNVYWYSVKTVNGNSEASNFSLPGLLEIKEAIHGKLSFVVSRIGDKAATISWAGALHRISYAQDLVLVLTGGQTPIVINEKVQQMQHYAELPDVQENINFYAAARNPSGLSAFQKVAVLKRKKRN